MKRVWLFFVREYIRLGLFFYFKKIEVISLNNVPKGKPVLFLSNHQNALLDALLIAVKGNRYSYFLTRAGVFKKPIVSKLLQGLQMLPVYRVRDGWSNISNNHSIFNTCTELLAAKESLVIFPEGGHNLKRSVRPLSKGFTRIVFETLEKYPNLDLKLIPIGLNFVKAEKCPDSVSIFFGNSINAQEFLSNDKHLAVNTLKNRIQLEMSELTTHIPISTYKEDLETLENLNVNFLKPKEVNTCITNNFVGCSGESKSGGAGLHNIFKVLLILSLIIPYLVWKYYVEPKIKEIEFKSTFRFAIAITLVPVYLLVLTLILAAFFSLKLALAYFLTVIILTLFTIKL